MDSLAGGSRNRTTAEYPVRTAFGKEDIVVHRYDIVHEPGQAPTTKNVDWRPKLLGTYRLPNGEDFDGDGEEWTLKHPRPL